MANKDNGGSDDPGKHRWAGPPCQCRACMSKKKVLYWHHMAMHAPTAADETDALELAMKWFDHMDMMAAIQSMDDGQSPQPFNVGPGPRSGSRH